MVNSSRSVGSLLLLSSIFIEVQITQVLSGIASRLHLIGSLGGRHLEIVTVSKILSISHVEGVMISLSECSEPLALIALLEFGVVRLCPYQG